MKRIVILGNGIAGFSAAEEIRKQDPVSEVLMLSEEDELPYSRPLLSKTSVRLFQRNGIRLVPESWYREKRILHQEGIGVSMIQGESRFVELENRTRIYYDKCIYALGARCFIPPFAGADRPGVMTVRTIADFHRIRRFLYVVSNVVVIGGGVIGLEMAWEFARMGVHVTILEAGPWIMGRLLDEQSAGHLTEKVRSAGVDVFAGVNITELTGMPAESSDLSEQTKVTGVLLDDGTWFQADMVIVSCGVRPVTDVAKLSGISCDRGVLVDEYMRTNIPNVFAAGDCIQWSEPNPGLWNYARVSGKAAGYNATDPDQYRTFAPQKEPVILSAMNTSLFTVGDVSGNGTKAVVEEGDDRSESTMFRINGHRGDGEVYKKMFYQNGRLCGAVLMGDLSDISQIKKELAWEGGRRDE